MQMKLRPVLCQMNRINSVNSALPKYLTKTSIITDRIQNQRIQCMKKGSYICEILILPHGPFPHQCGWMLRWFTPVMACLTMELIWHTYLWPISTTAWMKRLRWRWWCRYRSPHCTDYVDNLKERRRRLFILSPEAAVDNMMLWY